MSDSVKNKALMALYESDSTLFSSNIRSELWFRLDSGRCIYLMPELVNDFNKLTFYELVSISHVHRNIKKTYLWIKFIGIVIILGLIISLISTCLYLA
jgi:hypothetical protein